MSEQDSNITVFPSRGVARSSQEPSIIRAKSFRIRTSDPNFPQYKLTVNAYIQAGMPFEHIANAGDLLGDEVERGEIDAPLKPNWQIRVGEVGEEENQILAWQNRGEIATKDHQLEGPATVTGKEVVLVSNELKVGDRTSTPQLNVLEGVAVVKQEPVSLPENSNHDAELTNSPFLKKAA